MPHKSNHATRSAAHAALSLKSLEPLEPRRLLSVTLDSHGIVHVEGTRRHDAVQVTASTSKGRPTIHVNLNGHDFVFRAAAVRQIQILTGIGDDQIIDGVPFLTSLPHDTSDRTTVPMNVLAGAGNDTVTGSDANDTINGQAGDDVIYGFGGNDLITCGDGNDSVLGFGGQDTIDGGNGDDDLAGDAGYINHFPVLYAPGQTPPTTDPNDFADVITGGPGIDTFHNGDARAQQRDAGRHDRTVQDPIVE
jgi:Ca2+-binding RTX toxin-like protein